MRAKHLPRIPGEFDGSCTMVLHARPHASRLSQYTISLGLNLAELSDIKITYENSPKPKFIVLDDSKVWQEHGKLVTATHRYFPDSFDRLPCDPSKKIDLGYKAIEWLNYFWVLSPALF